MKRLLTLLLAALLLAGCTPVQNVHEPTWITEPFQTESQPFPEPVTQPFFEPSVSTQPLPEPADFVRISDYVPHARTHLYYATSDNFTGQVIYDFKDAYLRYGTVLKLKEAAQILEVYGYGLMIWDGYRPVYAQQRLWDAFPDPNYVSKPGTGGQNHCRGLAVDLTLYDLRTGSLLEMPTGFDDFSSYADRDYSDCTASAAANASLLEEVMIQCGFKGYSAEWWHYNDTQQYPIEYDFIPK